ncbi:MAG: type I DNA topoisomerase, partial [Pseudomonadota bacterium]
MVTVVIVESAAKAKTIQKYLGRDFIVKASYGHVRDLPSKNGSVDPDANFSMVWEADAKAKKLLNELTRDVKGADRLVLATDPDREGEAIAWHLMDVFEQKKALKDKEVLRVAFNSITKSAILDAMAQPREIDRPLVDAYLARRALDYLVGFNLSPVLWRKLPGSRSAGRVQSVALRLICDREDEIDAFKPQEYWSIVAHLVTEKSEAFEAALVKAGDKAINKLTIQTEAEAAPIRAALLSARSPFAISEITRSERRSKPSAPFSTSTLQQAASSRLGFSASRTMQVAQKLYEGVDIGGETVGLITYMRTDAVQIIPEAIEQCRKVINKLYGDRYLPSSARSYATKAKNAQEAHEAVRPTSLDRRPADVAHALDADGLRLYELIWQRTIASQMADSLSDLTSAQIDVTGGDGVAYRLKATGSIITFDGYRKVYGSGARPAEKKDAGSEEGDEAAAASTELPPLEKGKALSLDQRIATKTDDLESGPVPARQQFTKPPSRYSEASLVKKMEELGIGRPSTYASTIATLRDRDYVVIDKRMITPQDKGRLVTGFLKGFFAKYVQYDFTADLETKLDQISDN